MKWFNVTLAATSCLVLSVGLASTSATAGMSQSNSRQTGGIIKLERGKHTYGMRHAHPGMDRSARNGSSGHYESMASNYRMTNAHDVKMVSMHKGEKHKQDKHAKHLDIVDKNTKLLKHCDWDDTTCRTWKISHHHKHHHAHKPHCHEHMPCGAEMAAVHHEMHMQHEMHMRRAHAEHAHHHMKAGCTCHHHDAHMAMHHHGKHHEAHRMDAHMAARHHGMHAMAMHRHHD